jgi:hypothetical protein
MPTLQYYTLILESRSCRVVFLNNLYYYFLIPGFLSWDLTECHVDLEKELQAFLAAAPEGEEARHGMFSSSALYCIILNS